MGIALVAHTNVGGVSTTTTSAIDTTGSSFLILSIAYQNTATEPTISDSKSNTWTGLTVQDNLTDIKGRLFYVANPTVGSSHTFTFTGTNVFCGMCVASFSGTELSTVYDSHENGNVTAAATSLTSGSVTPSRNSCLLVTAFGLSGDITGLSIN